MPTTPKILVIQCAALGYDLARQDGVFSRATGMTFQPLSPVFPAVTCCAQATIRCATAPREHGVVANGFFNRQSRRVDFWNQSARMIDGDRLWANARRAGRRVAMICYQQSLGEDADFILSPAPIHKHHGGMIDACQSRPDELAAELTLEQAEAFFTTAAGTIAFADRLRAVLEHNDTEDASDDAATGSGERDADEPGDERGRPLLPGTKRHVSPMSSERSIPPCSTAAYTRAP